MPTRRSRRRLAALRRARAQLASAEVVVDLARALADVTTSPEAAQRVADAIPAATGCDQARVLLPDEHGRLVVRGAAGVTTDDSGAVGTEHFGMPVDQLPPTLVLRRDEAPEPAREAMTKLGLVAIAMVTVRVRDDVRALLTAEWTAAGHGPKLAELEPRLAAIAGQAATALGNARLLDTVRHQALHDALTGLPNQVLFDDRADHAVARARRNGERLAVGVLDLDRFKTINDSLGHRAGDNLLVQVADRLRAVVRAQDTVARMGGDEFTLLLPDLQPHGESIVAERVLAAFETPFDVDGHAIRVSPSIGLASFPADGDTPERLLRSADVAMYRAKENGRNTWATYATGMTERVFDRLTLESDLHRALERRELVLGFQPVVTVGSRQRVGVEALVRWSHPSFGLLAPAEFLGIADDLGIAVDIDRWVLRRACREAGRGDAAGTSSGTVAVNLSGRSLARTDLVDIVRAALAEGGLTPDRLVVEVTESVLAARHADVVPALGALRRLGVGVALDDFGRGHAPLAELGTLPLTMLKTDRSFVVGVRDPEADAPVLSAVVAMARALGLTVVAEGIETEAQLAFVARHGADLAQGHLLGRVETGAYVVGASSSIA